VRAGSACVEPPMDRRRKGIVAAPTHGPSGLSTDPADLLEHKFEAG
jgi:hypothetical protein